MAYMYTPPAAQDFPALKTPVPGTTGHFDHHDDLDLKVETLEDHLGVQLMAAYNDLKASVTALETAVTALTARVTALEP